MSDYLTKNTRSLVKNMLFKQYLVLAMSGCILRVLIFSQEWLSLKSTLF